MLNKDLSVEECDTETSSAQAATLLQHKEQNVQASMATGFHSSNKVGLKHQCIFLTIY